MNRVTTAAISAAGAAAIALSIVWVITLIRGTSIVDAINQPAFWLVESTTIVLTAGAILKRPSETAERGNPPSSSTTKVFSNAAWTAAAAVLIGTLLALATETGVAALLTSIKFLIPAAIAVAVGALEAWPDRDDSNSTD